MSRSKKRIISVYAQRLIKQHISYFIALAFFVFLLTTFIPYQVTDYVGIRSDLSKANEQINDFNARRSVIQKYPEGELNDLVITMNTLYPSEEDRFSIFTALDNLQAVTGIGIVTYSSPFSGRSFEEISIGVRAEADITTFRKFLRDYIFKSGRFMTIEKIVFDSDQESLNFTAKFHSKNVEIGDLVATKYSPDAIDRLHEIQAELESAGLIKRDLTNEEENIPVDYSTKSNPFE